MQLDIDGLKKLVGQWVIQQPPIPGGVTVTVVCDHTTTPMVHIVSSDPDDKIVSDIITFEKFVASGWSKSHANTVTRDIQHGVMKHCHGSWETLTVSEFLENFANLSGVGPKAYETVGQLLRQAGIKNLPRYLIK